MDAMVMLDVDGVLADLSAYEHLVAAAPKKWGEFFRHAGEALLIPAGAQLAATLDRLGFKVAYSTTRPVWCTHSTALRLGTCHQPQGGHLPGPVTAWFIGVRL